MSTLRHKVIVWVSAIVVTLALIALPGCAKKEKTPTPTKTDKAVKDLE